MTEPIRWGVAATGGIAAQFAAAMPSTTGGEIVAVASRSIANAQAFGDRFGIARRHASYESLASDPDVDVVYVASPHACHAADTLLFLEAGKHVLCEKPFSINHASGATMVAAARQNDRFLMEAIWSRFLPAYVTLAELLHDQDVGEPLLVEADFGFSVPVMPEHRLFNRELGGGALLDLGIYPLQLCSLVFGSPEQVKAVAQIGSTGVDEQIAAVLQHRGGGIGVVKAAIRTSLACRAQIATTHGSISLPPLMHCPDHLIVATRGSERRIDCPVGEHGLRFEIDEVHRCLGAGLRESTVMPLAETLALAATMDAIRAQVDLTYPGD